MEQVDRAEEIAFSGLKAVEENPTAGTLNNYTRYIFNRSAQLWKELEDKYWVEFGSGF